MKGKPTLGLWYSRDSPFELVAYTDSDYTIATQDMKSTTRGYQFLGNRLISWQCKKQTVVATSTTKAKYVAAANLLTKGFDAGRFQYLVSSGIDCFPTDTIFEELARMGAKIAAWNEFSSTMASAIICLATNQKFNLSRRKQRKETKVPQDETHHDDSVPIPSNDPLLSGEDKMQLTELMILCTNLQKQVLDLEKAKDAQAKEIAGLKKRVQKLERKKKSRTTGLKRLRKVIGEKQEQSAKVDEREVSTGVEDSAAPTILVTTAAKPKAVTSAATTTTTTRPKARGVVVQEPTQLQAKLIEEEKMARKKEEEANIALIES
ncbi:hypothetical protein Tco_0885342 [Tanacetum coccineum]